ncbi:hypothetical protein [Psychrobacter sp. JCM 18900]|uniref:hypothetical protein n=1 Tax=Psychrobacter sp. JCM 18900 TaxID=1298608 RepID=UPI0021C49007|nr:hypothetical protein [Psychrobacter sp. JCM 18900]
MTTLKWFALTLCLVLTACNSQTSTTSEVENSHSGRMNIVSPDWGNAATLTAMGHAPIATGDVRVWDRWVGSPKLPTSITDLGIRYQPTLS